MGENSAWPGGRHFTTALPREPTYPEDSMETRPSVRSMVAMRSVPSR